MKHRGGINFGCGDFPSRTTRSLAERLSRRTRREGEVADGHEVVGVGNFSSGVKNSDWSNKMSDLASNNRIRADHTEFATDRIDLSQAMDRLASSNVDVNGAAPMQFVIPVRIEASQLARMLEHGAVAAAGYAIVMADTNAKLTRSTECGFSTTTFNQVAGILRPRRV